MRLTPGIRLGPYEVLSVLGTGGMAEVYRARDTRLGREIAIKVVNESLVSHPELLQRFEQEARLAGSLNHPNLVAVHDVGQHDGSLYLVTELLAGETLRRRIERGPIPLNTTLDWAAQMAQGLAAAHARGIVHRDLKPDNIFLTADGHVKLLDFGIAKLVEGVQGDGHHGLMDATETPTGHFTRTGSTFGTPGYMSPEQVRGETLDARSDLFSLGAVLYEMLSGRRAFPGETVDSSYAILHNEPVALSSDVGPVVAQVVSRCLAKESTRRFQSASDLAFDLEVLRSPTSTSAPASRMKDRDRGGHLKGPWMAVAAALLLLVSAALVGQLARSRPPTAPSPTEIEEITHRPGTVGNARFLADGRVAFSAAFDGRSEELFVWGGGTPAPHALIKSARLAAVSRTGELAVLLDAFMWRGGAFGSVRGTLARLPAIGVAPRELAENAASADWSPAGDLAAVTYSGGGCRLESPLGKVLFQTAGAISDPRFSARGDRIAFVHHPIRGDTLGEVMLVDLQGVSRKLGQRRPFLVGLAWAPGDDELWFTAGEHEQDVLLAMDLEGKTRELYRSLGSFRLADVSADGRALVIGQARRMDTLFLEKSGGVPRLLSWSSWGNPVAVSADRSVLFWAQAPLAPTEEGQQRVLAVVRNADLSAAKILGEFMPEDLSSDGRSALGFPWEKPDEAARGASQVLVVPTGAGLPRRLEMTGVRPYRARWLPDGVRILLLGGNREDQEWRLYLVKDDGEAVRISDAAIGAGSVVWISPDGRWVATRDPSRRTILVSLENGTVTPVLGVPASMIPRGWGSNGSLWFEPDEYRPTTEILRIDVRTGQVLEKVTLAPADPTGVRYTANVLVAPGGGGFVYSSRTETGPLFLIKGLRQRR